MTRGGQFPLCSRPSIPFSRVLLDGVEDGRSINSVIYPGDYCLGFPIEITAHVFEASKNGLAGGGGILEGRCIGQRGGSDGGGGVFVEFGYELDKLADLLKRVG